MTASDKPGKPGAPGSGAPAEEADASPTGSVSSSAGRAGGAPLPRFGFIHLVGAIAEYTKSARCANDLDRTVVLERMRQEFETEPEVLLQRGFDKAYRQVMEGV